MPAVSVSKIAMEADFIISLPKFKTHGLTVITGAIKNSYGLLPGAQKAKLHKAAGNAERFHELLVDVFRLRVPDLFIVDAVVGMEGNGPASPDLREIGLILASDNAVAMDAVIATMMGCEPARLRFLQKAKEAGLGDYDPEYDRRGRRIEETARLQASPAERRSDPEQRSHAADDPRADAPSASGRSGPVHELRNLYRCVRRFRPVHERGSAPGRCGYLYFLFLLPGDVPDKGDYPEMMPRWGPRIPCCRKRPRRDIIRFE